VELVPLERKQTKVEDRMSGNRPASYNIGKALQRLRKDNGWTLATVSAKTGVAISTLSKIENNQSSPNYDVLVRLAEGLGVDFVELFKGRSFSTFAPGSRTINRAGDSIRYNTPLGEYHVLSSELAKKTLQPMLVCVPKGKQRPEILSNHGGEEFIYVLSGSLKFYMEPYRATILEQGDSVHFDGVMPHGFVAAGDEDAWILSLCLSEKEITEMSGSVISLSRGADLERGS
jgi:transcriptional regulator with XRE-family HTH domain